MLIDKSLALSSCEVSVTVLNTYSSTSFLEQTEYCMKKIQTIKG